MAPRDLRVSTALEIAVGTQFHAQLITEPDWEASWLLLPSSVSLISGAIVQPKNWSNPTDLAKKSDSVLTTQ